MGQKDKTAYLISCSDHYTHRLFAVDAYLKAAGYETTYVTSDFDHWTKEKFRCTVPGCVQIPARPYQKNLSAARILNHRDFARDAFQWLEKQPVPVLVVAQLPPNYMAKYGARYKKHHPQVKMVFDLFDLWPETFPYAGRKRLLALPFAVWAGVRDRYLHGADIVTAECELYRERLHDPAIEVVPLTTRHLENMTFSPAPDAACLCLCYLGAINNIVDIEGIAALTGALARRKRTCVHIIGGGEKKDELMQALEQTGAQVIDHGIVYEEREKHAILDGCHFGLNMMSHAVCVGLTMKSVDYFKHGIPILSNIPADTQQLIEQRQVGFQVTQSVDAVAEKVAALSTEELTVLRENARAVFHDCFDLPVIMARYEEIFRDIL
jgi:glycosyltransferase involved in cell wall biosynthesis